MARTANAKPAKIDKYNKNQSNVSPFTWISIAGFFLAIIVLLIVLTPNNPEKILKAYEAYGVTTMPEDHPLYQIKYEGSLFKKGLKDIIEKEEVVIVYIGYAACPGCQTHVTPISTYFTSTGMNQYTDKVYYMDVTADIKGFEALSAAHAGFATSTPQIALFINGEMVKLYAAANADTSTSTMINRNIRNFYEDGIDLINA